MSYIIKALPLYRILSTLAALIPSLLNNLLTGPKAEVLTHYFREFEHVNEDKTAEYELKKRICNSIN